MRIFARFPVPGVSPRAAARPRLVTRPRRRASPRHKGATGSRGRARRSKARSRSRRHFPRARLLRRVLPVAARFAAASAHACAASAWWRLVARPRISETPERPIIHGPWMLHQVRSRDDRRGKPASPLPECGRGPTHRSRRRDSARGSRRIDGRSLNKRARYELNGGDRAEDRTPNAQPAQMRDGPPGFPIPRFPDSPIPGFPDSPIPRFPDSQITRFSPGPQQTMSWRLAKCSSGAMDGSRTRRRPPSCSPRSPPRRIRAATGDGGCRGGRRGRVIDRIQAVAFRQEVLQRAAPRRVAVAEAAVGGRELGARFRRRRLL